MSFYGLDALGGRFWNRSWMGSQ